MKNKKTKGLILAAGYGSRLKPISNRIPKPLWPLGGVTLLEMAITKLKSSGIKEIVVNTHHLSKSVDEFLRRKYKENIQVSIEKDILGTGGALNPIKEWVGDSNLLIYNSDVITDFNLNTLLLEQKPDSLATMLVLPESETAVNNVFFEKNLIRKIRGTSGLRAGAFSGVQLVTPEFLQAIPNQTFSDIIETYQTLLAQHKKITKIDLKGYWKDLGTPLSFFQAHQDLLKMSEAKRQKIGWINTGVIIDKKSIIDRKVHFENRKSIGNNVFLYKVGDLQPTIKLENVIIFDTGSLADDDYSNMIIHGSETIQLNQV